MTADVWVSAGYVILGVMVGFLLALWLFVRGQRQQPAKEKERCPHGHLDWDECPVCSH